MSEQLDVTEAEFHAYVDGQLPPARRAAVEAYVTEHPEEAGRLADYDRLNEALHAAFDPVLQEPLPESLHATRPRARAPAPLWRVAAAVGWVALGGLLGWSASWLGAPQTASIEHELVRPATVAHVVYTPEVRHPVEVLAAEEVHLAKWLSKRLGAPVRVPDLNSAGFQLVGGRLLPGSEGAAAQFMYEDASGRRLTLYVRPTPGEPDVAAFRYAVRDGVGVFYWLDGALGYALSGALAREDLLSTARMVYEELSL